MKIKYNAPVTLTFSFICIGVLLISFFLSKNFVFQYFALPSSQNFQPANPFHYLLLFTHVFGHTDWEHLIGNLAFILLLGPMLEEIYSSPVMLLMVATTAFVTGVVNVCFFPTGLMGASGIVFMMILLASFSNNMKSGIPLTFILIVILYIGRDIADAFTNDNISHLAHLVGGLCGSLFGFFRPTPQVRRRSVKKAAAATEE
ncbi:rhomboid family intramembrane serine protease [Treponema phagedenis]|uniref:Peptidase, S54 family n=1 Tax=Treponema phagedenis TaxID=162 RepID=A0A0B7GYC6_TREPH|nr:rhomboid family intramembrane serine protease [Treponema phagedenis]EFW38422.1 peptidase, S54 family [Treponema phagedenis F0421]NVP25214.1 rhomboid family intramembrane serine protease [Treponema phagedenis]NVP25530.1 rhomboid family intramembrane serine protease [Treponema phagedenis]QEJ95926.1 rhomboid family intramembrane serine protease [Treponema phagedenis]QEJ97330.1 rhomboid family intramembrane serine protease [Treponema phagedenis]